MSTNDSTNYDTLFGRFALDNKLCTDDEIRICQVEQKQLSQTSPVTLEQVLVKNRYITKSQCRRVRSYIKASKDTSTQIPGYKVQGKLGSGAMAVVYKAKQISLDRTVAVKVLPRRFSEKPDYIRRFFKEGKIAAKMNHNNIVQAIDVGESNGLYFFVMEYVEGKTLYDDLSQGKIFSEEEALGVIIQLANALAHAHSQGLIHRDVKPKNVMINKEGVVKLADMGLARETSDIKAAKHEQGKAFGTPYYIAPEQIRGELDIDGRADIYALGATFYNMVTGKVPFEAETPAEVMKKHLKEPLTPPDHINTNLSAGISEVIETMMAKKVTERYTNMEELLSDLEAIQRGESPLQARRKFDFAGLEELQQGQAIDPVSPKETAYCEEAIAKYRMIVVFMGAIIGVLILAVIFMAGKM